MSSTQKLITVKGFFALLFIFAFSTSLILSSIRIGKSFLQKVKSNENTQLQIEDNKVKDMKEDLYRIENIILGVYVKNKDDKSKEQILEVVGDILSSK